MTTAELGNHTKEHDRNGLVVEQRRSWIKEARVELVDMADSVNVHNTTAAFHTVIKMYPVLL